jgi:hypothetical protein
MAFQAAGGRSLQRALMASGTAPQKTLDKRTLVL